MSDESTTLPASRDSDDIELLTAYIREQLAPEKVALVRQRLDDDPEFRDLAAPLLLAWHYPPRWKVEPLPPGELERHWDRFTKRAGFAHQKRRARRRRALVAGGIVLLFAAAAWLFRGPVREWYSDRRDFEPVEYREGWFELRHGIHVRLARGAELRARRGGRPGGSRLVKLKGAADFRVERLTKNPIAPPDNGFEIETAGGMVGTLEADFSVRTSGDTTWVEVRRPGKPQLVGGFALPTFVYVQGARGAAALHDDQRARIVKDQPVERLP